MNPPRVREKPPRAQHMTAGHVHINLKHVQQQAGDACFSWVLVLTCEVNAVLVGAVVQHAPNRWFTYSFELHATNPAVNWRLRCLAGASRAWRGTVLCPPDDLLRRNQG